MNSQYSKTGPYQGGQKPRYKPKHQQPSVPATPAPPFGSVIELVRPNDLDSDARQFENVAVIKDCKTLTSYNWLDKREPTIMIPGEPPRWTPLTAPRQLPEDSGTYFRDINGARHPKHPMEPTVIAGLAADPKLPQGVDVVACGSTLGNLLRFVRGEDKPFRMLVQEIHGTVFLIRRENSPTEVLHDVRGHGHAFPEAYTTWDPEVKGSVSHQRVLRYSFGKLNLLVRFGGDGYLENGNGTAPALSSKAKPKQPAPTVEDLLGSLATSSVSSRVPTSAAEVKTTQGGRLIDQSQIFDLKTRGAWKKASENTVAIELPRLWIAQVPNFILAYHERGVFKDINVKPVRDEVKKWEKQHKSELSRFAALLHRVIAKVRKRTDHKIEICHQEVGVLEVRKQLPDAGDALSAAVQKMWERGLTTGEIKSDKSEYREKGAVEEKLISWDEGALDFTGCSSDCDYCGRCTY